MASDGVAMTEQNLPPTTSTGRALSVAGDPNAPMGLRPDVPYGCGTQPKRGMRDRWDLPVGAPDETGTFTA